MSPEILVQLVQLGSVGLLAFVLWHGIQSNARMLDILAEVIKDCVQSREVIEERIAKLEAQSNSAQEETD